MSKRAERVYRKWIQTHHEHVYAGLRRAFIVAYDLGFDSGVSTLRPQLRSLIQSGHENCNPNECNFKRALILLDTVEGRR